MAVHRAITGHPPAAIGLLASTALTLMAAPGPAGAQIPRPGEAGTRTATVSGVVLAHEGAQPLAGAAVSLEALPHDTTASETRLTDEQGRFFFPLIPAGDYSLAVARLGYRTRTDTVRVDADSDVRLVVQLATEPVELEPITAIVTRRWLSPAMQEFEDRRRRLYGTFFTRDDIEARNPTRISDMLAVVPGSNLVNGEIRFVRGTGIGGLLGGCRPVYWIDGMRMDQSVDLLIPPDAVEAIEVYTSIAEIPIRYRTTGCGVVLIWLRAGGSPDPLPPRRLSRLWKGLVLVAGIVSLGILASH